jgi:hypothetical protein
MAAHAKLSASGSHRWLACPASVTAEQGLPETRSSFANEGTAAHELAEIVLRTQDDCAPWIGSVLPETKWTVDQEMADYVQQYVDYAREQMSHARNAFAAFEVRVDFSDWIPGGFGTCDALIISGDTAHVIDLKYGKGVPVSPVENTQAMLYALGAYADAVGIVEIKQVQITIVQPRVFDGEPQSWTISVEDLLRWGEWAKQRAEACLAPDAEFVPGDKQCQWCKAKPTCRALATMTEKTIMAEFEDISTPDALRPVNRMTDAEIAEVLRAKALISSWLEAVEDRVVERLTEGEGFPGYKLVAGKANRRWSDEKQAGVALFEMIGDAAYTQKLLSPTQAEKVLGRVRAQEISSLVFKPQGAPTLVVESDPRPSVGGISADDF